MFPKHSVCNKPAQRGLAENGSALRGGLPHRGTNPMDGLNALLEGIKPKVVRLKPMATRKDRFSNHIRSLIHRYGPTALFITTILLLSGTDDHDHTLSAGVPGSQRRQLVDPSLRPEIHGKTQETTDDYVGSFWTLEHSRNKNFDRKSLGSWKSWLTGFIRLLIIACIAVGIYLLAAAGPAVNANIKDAENHLWMVYGGAMLTAFGGFILMHGGMSALWNNHKLAKKDEIAETEIPKQEPSGLFGWFIDVGQSLKLKSRTGSVFIFTFLSALILIICLFANFGNADFNIFVVLVPLLTNVAYVTIYWIIRANQADASRQPELPATTI